MRMNGASNWMCSSRGGGRVNDSVRLRSGCAAISCHFVEIGRLIICILARARNGNECHASLAALRASAIFGKGMPVEKSIASIAGSHISASTRWLNIHPWLELSNWGLCYYFKLCRVLTWLQLHAMAEHVRWWQCQPHDREGRKQIGWP